MFIIRIFNFFTVVSCASIINKIKNDFIQYPPVSEKFLLKEDKNFWYNIGLNQLEKSLKFNNEPKLTIAKNVIIFIGDGMGLSTVTASRIYKGQRDFDKSGEDHNLVFEDFPNVALVKTYNVDMQVPDSAGTATALFTGVKARFESIGVDVNCNKTVIKEIYEKCKLDSLMTWAQENNKDTGIITTTRITHATPAATYAHIHHRKWECDEVIPENYRDNIKDISRQLIEDAPGKNFKVILGGGYQQLGHINEDESNGECTRTDGRNLTQLWIENHKNENYIFATNNEELQYVSDNTDYLLGLFHPDNLPYQLVRDKGPRGTPSLLEMTDKGLKILQKNPNGFVLMVEGGRIDHGHHDNYARLALGEASDFDDAISLALKRTGPDTLIIVTADHSHSLTLNGYGYRGNDILGTTHKITDKKKAMLTLTYATGPGFSYHYKPTFKYSELQPWLDPVIDQNRLSDPYYRQLSTVQLESANHAGEDVAVYAKGPGSHLIRGVFEQNFVAHVISYTACIGPRAALNKDCHNYTLSKSSVLATSNLNYYSFISILFLLFIVFN